MLKMELNTRNKVSLAHGVFCVHVSLLKDQLNLFAVAFNPSLHLLLFSICPVDGNKGFIFKGLFNIYRPFKCTFNLVVFITYRMISVL
ncbi:hypothetical protein H4Q32_014688 [Labeo rohita]|uniref:Uncharacterized protein n=1 Tax=Labeo rohita TaxID=84645 RepID=A0ABQ8LMP2_LABRO|nr:hypothetical protein H4Q32_014688 [Labeo rohita]